MEKFMENVKKYSKFIGLGGLALVIISVLFLPFLKVTVSFLGYKASETVKFIDAWEGKVALICAIVAAVGFVLKKVRLASIPTLLTLVFTIWGVIDGKGENTLGLGKISCSWGFYLIILGVVAAASYIYFDYKNSKQSIKEYFNFKNDFNDIKTKVTSQDKPQEETK